MEVGRRALKVRLMLVEAVAQAPLVLRNARLTAEPVFSPVEPDRVRHPAKVVRPAAVVAFRAGRIFTFERKVIAPTASDNPGERPTGNPTERRPPYGASLRQARWSAPGRD